MKNILYLVLVSAPILSMQPSTPKINVKTSCVDPSIKRESMGYIPSPMIYQISGGTPVTSGLMGVAIDYAAWAVINRRYLDKKQ